MSFELSAKSGGNFTEAPPAGNHAAVLVALVDLGTQEIPPFKGVGAITWKRQVYLAWELVTEQIGGSVQGANHVIARAFAVGAGGTLHPKSTLRQYIEKWRNEEMRENEKINLSSFLGKSCFLSIVQKTSENDNVYARIDGLSAVPKDPATNKPMKIPEPRHMLFCWSMGDGEPPTLDWLPYLLGKPVADVIKRSKELSGTVPLAKPKDNTSGRTLEAPHVPDYAQEGGDNIPF